MKRALVWLLVFGLGSATGAYFALRSSGGATPDAADSTYYYCPMHPSFRYDKPGECPVCNMTLVKAGEKPEPGAQAGERKILYWQDPMNPAHRSDKPGKAPDGMDLVPVYADEVQAAELPPGTVKITPEKQQLIGVQYGEVLHQTVAKSIRATGRLAFDETKIVRLHPKVEGWVERVQADFLGKEVRKGEPLLAIYSPELVATQQEFLLARKARESLGRNPYQEIATGSHSLYESSLERLRLWDISERQIEEIAERGTPQKTLTLYSPIDGFVMSRNAFQGQRITPETELYAIADLSTIWVLADVYEYELPLLRIGQTGVITLPYFAGKSFRAKVSYIYPELDKATRTLRVRLEFRNPGLQFKPHMYANVELRIELGHELTLPVEAVLDSGSEQVVFVAREGGYFEPRRVTLGERVGDFYVVLSGVQAGERVVTSANFLVDSESRLKSALGQMKH